MMVMMIKRLGMSCEVVRETIMGEYGEDASGTRSCRHLRGVMIL